MIFVENVLSQKMVLNLHIFILKESSKFCMKTVSCSIAEVFHRTVLARYGSFSHLYWFFHHNT